MKITISISTSNRKKSPYGISVDVILEKEALVILANFS